MCILYISLCVNRFHSPVGGGEEPGDVWNSIGDGVGDELAWVVARTSIGDDELAWVVARAGGV